MPALAALFSSLLASLSVFLAKMFAIRLAVRLVGVAAIVAAGTALTATFNAFVAPLVQQIFTTQYGQFLGLVFPPIAGTVVASLMALWLAIITYKWQVRAIALSASL